MAKLISLLDGKLLGEYALEKERVTIGRRPSNDIHIDNLAVSGEHAMILTLGNDSFLEDLNSTNGTLVNKKLIKKHVLQHNDLIEFGKYQLKFISAPQVKSSNSDGFANTVSIKPAVKNAEAAKVPSVTETAPVKIEQESALPASAPLQKAMESENLDKSGHIQVLSGDNSGQELLLNKAMVKLGKPGEQLAVITKRPHGYFITHVEGNNYPLVNGQSIGGQAHALKDHDVIELSGMKMEFHLA